MGAPTPRRARGPRSSSTTRSRPKADTGVGYSVSSSPHAESRSIPLVQSRTIGRMEESARSAETVQALLERGDRRRLVDLLTAAHPADVAALLRELPLEAQVTVFRLLSAQRAGEVLSELDDQTLLQLVQALDQLEVSRILDEMPPDHAAEVVEELPPAQAESLLEMMKEEQSEDVQELLEYSEDTAGRLMSPNAVAVGESATVAEAIEQIRKSAPAGRGFELYVVDRRSPREIALMRLPWILTTLLIELGAGIVIHYYDATLSRVILLASFMPVIQAISGNTGLQSVTMVVRGLATGHVQLARWWEPLLRQIQTTSIIGAVCGVVVGILGAVWHGTVSFGLVVAVSMFISVNLSGAAGTAIPMVSKSLGFDPALTAGPFETALQDVLGVTIFLGLATALLRFLA